MTALLRIHHIALALGALACSSDPAGTGGGGGANAGGAGGPGAVGGAGGGAGGAPMCSTPADEDLDAYLAAAVHGGPPGGPSGPSGAGGGPGPGGGGPGEGGAPNPGNGGTGGAGGGPGGNDTAVLIPNEFGSGQSAFATFSFPVTLGVLANTHGTNGRHCETCHSNDGGWTIRPETIVRRLELGEPHFILDPYWPTNASATTNDDLEPIFRLNDGANSPVADVSTPDARVAAYSMLLSRGVFRIGLPVPEDGELELVAVDDPYDYASEAELSLYRRPNLMANLRFHPTLMWDGRETTPCEKLTANLEGQANEATRGHAQAMADLSPDQVARITAAELVIYVAQSQDAVAGLLDEDGALGGPTLLIEQPFYAGINAFDGSDPEGKPFDPVAFTLYQAWLDEPGDTPASAARALIARGEELFNTRTFTVEGVSGFNDELGQASITATCTSCHDTPNVGTSSRGRMMDLGISSADRAGVELPIYTFRNKTTGEELETTDPGRALITGAWREMNRFKVPMLRGNAVRPPYFHDGSAPTLEAAVRYHDDRFAIGLTPDEVDALTRFLSAL